MPLAQTSQQPTPDVNISGMQLKAVANDTLAFLKLPTTLVPGNIRRQLDVLELVLTGLREGSLVVASPDQLAVESTLDKVPEPDDGQQPKTPVETKFRKR